MTLLLMLILVTVVMFSLPLIPRRYAQLRPAAMGWICSSLIVLQFFLASCAAARCLTNEADLTLELAATGSAWSPNVWLDPVSGMMLALVGFLGLTISRFSFRYLKGDSSQGNYYRWLSFTLAAVSWMVIAGDLLSLAIASSLVSLGLHRLLLNGSNPRLVQCVRHRRRIMLGAHVLLFAAAGLAWSVFGTLEMSVIFDRIANEPSLAGASLIVWLLAISAIVTSVQFPLHTWLVHTLDSPTPVSALMHGGIVNGGGYLIIRLSPLISTQPTALALVAALGAVTACFGAIVMLTQPSVKRALVYSTIAQMGLMMLQCGLGAYSLAFLHILAHSLYKAFAFLNSGAVIDTAKSLRMTGPPATPWIRGVGRLGFAAGVSLMVGWLVASSFQIAILSKPGALVLALTLAMAYWTWKWTVRNAAVASMGIITLGLLYASYSVSFTLVDSLTQSALPASDGFASPVLLQALIAAGFLLLFALQLGIDTPLNRTGWLSRTLIQLRVHASNGFYVDAIWYRFANRMRPTLKRKSA